MSMGMHFDFSPRIEITMQYLLQQIVPVLLGIRVGSDYSPEVGLRAVLARVVSKIDDSSFKTMVEVLANNSEFQSVLLDHSNSFVGACDPNSLKEIGLKEIAVSFYFKALGSERKIEKGLFRDAVLSPVTLQERINGYNKSIGELEAQKETRLGLTRDKAELLVNFYRLRNEQTGAQDIAKLLSDPIANFCNIVRMLCLLDDGVLHHFLRDCYLLGRLDFFLSERLANRFGARFKDVTAKSAIKNYEVRMLNTVSDFVLISLGIVDPDIFKLQKKVISPEGTSFFKGFCEDLSLDPVKLAAHYQLQPSGTIFWNRYFVKGQQPSKLTDEAIRRFGIEILRNDGEEILAALDFESVFNNLKGVIPPLKRAKDMEAIGSTLNEALVEMLEREAFVTCIVDKIRSPAWVKALNMFY